MPFVRKRYGSYKDDLIKTTLNKAIDYICNPDKTDNQILISLWLLVSNGRYEYVLTTHIDKGHIHNHIIFCAVNFLFAVAGLLSILASVSFTLFLSAGCKSTVSSLAVSLVFCIAPAVISMTVPGELSTWLCSILPASGTSIQASVLYAMTDFRFLNLAGLSVWTPYAMIGFCMIEIPLFAFLAVRSYCRHEWN